MPKREHGGMSPEQQRQQDDAKQAELMANLARMEAAAETKKTPEQKAAELAREQALKDKRDVEIYFHFSPTGADWQDGYLVEALENKWVENSDDKIVLTELGRQEIARRKTAVDAGAEERRKVFLSIQKASKIHIGQFDKAENIDATMKRLSERSAAQENKNLQASVDELIKKYDGASFTITNKDNPTVVVVDKNGSKEFGGTKQQIINAIEKRMMNLYNNGKKNGKNGK